MHIDIYKDIYTKRNILLTVTYNSHFSMLSLNLINRSKEINTVLTLRCNQVPMLLQKPDSNSCYYYYYYQQYKQRGAEAIKCSVTATGFRLAAVEPYVKSSSSVVDRQVSGGQNRSPWLHVANQNVNISSTTFRIFW